MGRGVVGGLWLGVVSGLLFGVVGGLGIGVVVLELDVAGGLGLWLAGSLEIGAVEVLGLCVVGKLGPVVVRVLGVVSLEAGIALGGGFVEPMGLDFAVVVVRIVSRAAYLVDWALS